MSECEGVRGGKSKSVRRRRRKERRLSDGNNQRVTCVCRGIIIKMEFRKYQFADMEFEVPSRYVELQEKGMGAQGAVW